MKAMHAPFYKYHATGNDFVIVDDREARFPDTDRERIARMCHRRFGIGADGLILIRKDSQTDFRMVYFNADGAEGSLCGNGARCAVAFASELGLLSDPCHFMAVDGMHQARLLGDEVALQMGDVTQLRCSDRYTFLDTGSPHHVQEVEALEAMNVAEDGRRIRYGLYGDAGSNINFVQMDGDARIRVRTYERGVEDETYSCGTGVTAVALAMHRAGRLKSLETIIDTRGGTLKVRFSPDGAGGYRDTWLIGPAVKVFEGHWI